MKIQYIGTQPIAVMGVGYSGIVDKNDVIEVDEVFFNEVKNSSKWRKFDEKVQKSTAKETK